MRSKSKAGKKSLASLKKKTEVGGTLCARECVTIAVKDELWRKEMKGLRRDLEIDTESGNTERTESAYEIPGACLVKSMQIY